MIHLSHTLTLDFVPLVAIPRLEEMGDDRLYIYRHTVTVSSGFVSSVLLTNCAVPRLEEMGDDRLYGIPSYGYCLIWIHVVSITDELND